MSFSSTTRLGHLTCKIVPKMIHHVSSWTLNPTLLTLYFSKWIYGATYVPTERPINILTNKS